MSGCETCGGDRFVETEEGLAVRCPDCTADKDLHARRSDPETSEEAGMEVQRREGSTSTVTRGSHKHRLLKEMLTNPGPEIDRVRGERAGISHLSCPWHRVGDLIDAGFAIEVDMSGYDAVTKKRVRRTTISGLGRRVLDDFADGKRRVVV